MRRAVLLLGGLREKDKLKDSGLKMELFHLKAGILHLRGRKIIRTLICSRRAGNLLHPIEVLTYVPKQC